MKMVDDVEYRSVIKFLILRGKTPAEIIKELNEGYGSEAPSTATIYRWIGYFKGGRTSVFDETKSGRPMEIDEKITEKCKNIIGNDRKITIRELSKGLNVSTGYVHNILDQCGIRKLCSRFVPKFLTPDMCQNRQRACESNLQLYDELGAEFVRNIITVDETPLSLYIPESKRESLEWKFPGETASKKMRSGTCHAKAMMLTVFWDWHGILTTDFADSNVKINSEYYSQLVSTCRKARRKKRNVPLWFLQDNAPVHKSAQTMQQILECGLQLLDHPPYSPDLAPSDFYLFKHLKKHLRGKSFKDKESLRSSVNDFFSNQPEKFFQNAFDEMVNRWRKCLENNGSYIEK